MVVHFNTVLLKREFGAHLLSVEKFQNWLDQKGLEVPLDPPLSHWKFIQVEALLCAIERGANAGITDSEADQLIQQIPRLSVHEHASLVPTWLLGAEAHWNWRERIRQAVKDGELQLLDFVSKLPLSPEPPPAPAAQEPPLAPAAQVPAGRTKETAEQRQNRRYQMCIDAGLKLPDNDYARLPSGISDVAAQEGITRQAFSEDVKAHINRMRGR